MIVARSEGEVRPVNKVLTWPGALTGVRNRQAGKFKSSLVHHAQMRFQQGSKRLIALASAQEQAKDCRYPCPSFLIGSRDAGFEFWARCKGGQAPVNFVDSILSYFTMSATLVADVRVFERFPGPSCSI